MEVSPTLAKIIRGTTIAAGTLCLLTVVQGFDSTHPTKTGAEALATCGPMTDIDRRDSPATVNRSTVDGTRITEDITNIGSCVELLLSDASTGNLVKIGSISTGEMAVVVCAAEHLPILGVATGYTEGWVRLDGSALQTYQAGGFDYQRPCDF